MFSADQLCIFQILSANAIESCSDDEGETLEGLFLSTGSKQATSIKILDCLFHDYEYLLSPKIV